MSKTNLKWLAALLSAFMLISLLGSCNQQPQPGGSTNNSQSETSAPESQAPASENTSESKTEGNSEETTAEQSETTNVEESEQASESESQSEPETKTESRDDSTLVVAMSEFSEKFSPFYATTIYDREIADRCTVYLLATDREGDVVKRGIEGEDRMYNGKNYHYSSMANLDVKINDEKDEKGAPKDTVYTFEIRNDVKFSDGEPLTMDDVMFSIYALLDPAYTGSSTLASLPIVGLQEYRTQTSTALVDKYQAIWKEIVAAGPAFADKDKSDKFSAEQYDKLWAMLADKAKEGSNKLFDMLSEDINEKNIKRAFGEDTKFTEDQVKGDDGLKAAFALKMWNLVNIEDNHLKAEGKNEKGEEVKIDKDLSKDKLTKEDVYNIGRIMYNSNDVDFISSELSDFCNLRTIEEDYINAAAKEDPDAGKEQEPVKHVSGIKKIDDTHFSITLKGFDASAIYKISVFVAPLHYYGNKDLYDYDAGKFGFPFKDLSALESKTKVPMGAGPYVFKKFENKTVYFEANPLYWEGAPKIKHLQYKTTPEKDKIVGITSGIVDVADPSFSKDRAQEIRKINGGELDGKVIHTSLVDNLGYGYIGICAKNVKVGDDPGSEQSKCLRKALATIIAQERALAMDSFYGDAAGVINYPISNTSWAAPRPGDEGYKVAFSEDPEGKPIYKDGMDEKAKREAAKNAAIEYFKKAGYTYDESSKKLTKAPEGAKLQYTVIVPGEGTGDHPSFKLITEARNILAEIGFTLDINDPAQSTVLWDTLDSGNQELWCAAWQATPDPDMYQIYHSSSIRGAGGTNNNHYCIADKQLDEFIIEARQSEDHEFRKTMYKSCLDILIDWAVEIPIYQRKNCVIFSTERINLDTLTPDITTFWNWTNDMHKLEVK